MSFFSPPAAAFKAQALNGVEGFHADDSSTPTSSTTGNNSSFGDLFSTTTTWGGVMININSIMDSTFPNPFESSLRP